jgi:hypothetical protein
MRIGLLVISFTLLLASAVCAAEKPPIDISIYPGGQSTLEINLTNDEFMPMLDMFLPMVTEKLGKFADKIKPDDIASLLRDLKRVEFVQVDVSKANVTELEIAAYYSKCLPPGKWNRLFWQTADKLGTVGLYSLDGFTGLYGFRVSKEQIEGKTVYRAMVGKIEGTIDFIKLLNMASKMIGV